MITGMSTHVCTYMYIIRYVLIRDHLDLQFHVYTTLGRVYLNVLFSINKRDECKLRIGTDVHLERKIKSNVSKDRHRFRQRQTFQIRKSLNIYKKNLYIYIEKSDR